MFITFILIVGGLVGVATLCGWLYWKHATKAYEVKGVEAYKPKPLLTPNEIDFFGKLQQAAGSRYLVFPQVSMGALMDTCLAEGSVEYWNHRMTFSGKIVDFVLCDAKTLKVQLVVELDDVMHDFSKDAQRDKLMALAGYRTLRFWSRNKPSVPELRERLNTALALNEQPQNC